MKKTAPPSAPAVLYLEVPAPALSPAQAGDAAQARPRTFSGIAYSGEPFNYWGDPIVIDLASLSLPDPCPVLLQHERDKRIGKCTLAVGLSDLRTGLPQLLCNGALLSNDAAQELAVDADEGFPWQLSIHAEAGSVETVPAGTQVQVNGRTLAGPLSVHRQTRIRELSFTPTGVDYRTEAHILSADPLAFASPTEAQTMPDPNPLEAQVADLTAQVAELTTQLAAVAARAETAEIALADHRRSARLAAVTATFAKRGRTVTEADAAVYLALSDEAWTQVAKDLQTAPVVPGYLMSEQATGDPAAPAPTLNLSAIYAARREVIQ